jgi:hypothetical protein
VNVGTLDIDFCKKKKLNKILNTPFVPKYKQKLVKKT